MALASKNIAVTKVLGRIALKLAGAIVILWLAGQAGAWSFLYLYTLLEPPIAVAIVPAFVIGCVTAVVLFRAFPIWRFRARAAVVRGAGALGAAARGSRRRFRFSMRTLLLIVGLCAVLASWFPVTAAHDRTERAALSKIKEAGGREKEWREFAGLFHRVSSLSFTLFFGPTGVFTDDTLKGLLPDLKQLRHLDALEFANTDVTDSSVGALVRERPYLKSLSLEGTRTTDAGLDAIKSGLPRLEQLCVARSKVTIDGVLAFREAMPNCRLDGVFDLSAVIRLRAIEMSVNSPITDAHVPRLVPKATTTSLYANSLAIGGRALEYIGTCENLECLELTGTDLTDAGLRSLGGLKSLKKLSLDNDNVSDDGLRELAGCHGLSRLSLECTHVTKEGVELLKDQLPQCEVEWSTLRSEDARLAVIELERMGVQVDVATSAAKRPEARWWVSLDNDAIESAGRINGLLKRITPAEDLEIQVIGWQPDVMACVRDLKGLVKLQIAGDSIGDTDPVDLVVLRTIGEIKELSISGEQVTDKQLAEICDVKSLESLEISSSCAITGSGVEQVAKLRKLKALFLWDIDDRRKYDDPLLAHLERLDQVRTLRVVGRTISDQGLARVANMPSLESLDITGEGITDAGLDALAAAPQLTELTLRGDQFTEEALVHLGKLRRLKRLTIETTSIPQDAVKRFRAEHPSIELLEIRTAK
jgi:Leucine-rich repeat (LRR) protein